MVLGGAAQAVMDPERRGRVVAHPGVREAFTAHVGMVVFLASWAMMFASLLLSYGLVRSRAPVWPPLDQPPLPRGLPGLNVAVAAASSVALVSALRAFRAGVIRRGAGALAVALALGSTFLALQFVVWTGLWRAGLRPDGGPYPSAFYALTAFHGLHVAVGLLALGWLTLRAFHGKYGPARHLPVRLWAMYWHFVGAVWAVIYGTVYVL